MIFDDLRVQFMILVDLYEHITEVLRVCDVVEHLLEVGEDVTMESVKRQLVILERKGLVSFVVLHEEASLKITGDGCKEAEVELIRQQ